MGNETFYWDGLSALPSPEHFYLLLLHHHLAVVLFATAEEALPLERKFLDCVKGSDSILNDAIAAVELVVDESHTVTSVLDRKKARDNYLISFAFIDSHTDQFVFLKSCSIDECCFKITSNYPGRQGRNKIVNKNELETKLYTHSSVDDVAVYTANISRETNHFDFA